MIHIWQDLFSSFCVRTKHKRQRALLSVSLTRTLPHVSKGMRGGRLNGVVRPHKRARLPALCPAPPQPLRTAVQYFGVLGLAGSANKLSHTLKASLAFSSPPSPLPNPCSSCFSNTHTPHHTPHHTFRRARELLVKSGAKWKKPSGQVVMRGQDYVEGDKMNRYGTLATLIFNLPHLYATLVGSGW